MIAVKSALALNIPLLLISLVWIEHETLSPVQRILAIFYIMFVYNLISYGYCHIFNMSETARRIRLLNFIHSSDNPTYEKILSQYQTKNIIQVRLERLITMNQIEKINNRFFLKAKILAAVASIVLNWGIFLKYNQNLKERLKR